MARASPKTRRIYEAGLPAYGGEPPPSADKMLKAIALMLTEATKPVKKKKPKEDPVLPFGPGQVYDIVRERAGHIVACEPYNKNWFGRLGAELRATNGLEADDLGRFVDWILGGGLEFFPDVTFAHVVKNWGTWIVKARAGGSGQQTGRGAEEFMG